MFCGLEEAIKARIEVEVGLQVQTAIADLVVRVLHLERKLAAVGATLTGSAQPSTVVMVKAPPQKAPPVLPLPAAEPLLKASPSVDVVPAKVSSLASSPSTITLAAADPKPPPLVAVARCPGTGNLAETSLAKSMPPLLGFGCASESVTLAETARSKSPPHAPCAAFPTPSPPVVAVDRPTPSNSVAEAGRQSVTDVSPCSKSWAEAARQAAAEGNADASHTARGKSFTNVLDRGGSLPAKPPPAKLRVLLPAPGECVGTLL